MTKVDTISTALIAAHQSGQRADAGKLPVPDYDEALEVQRRVQAELGAVSGFKVIERPDARPFLGPISAASTVPSGGNVSVKDQIGIELEIGFELIAEPSDDMTSDPKAFFRPRLVIELVDTRLDGADELAMLKLADMQLNAGLVVGPEMADWDGRDFGATTAFLCCGDQQVLDGETTVPGGSALSNLALFCTNIGAHLGGLQKGQIVITGSLTGCEFFPGGIDVTGRVEGFGEISVHLV
ncbi:hydratase [Aliiruegeria lutimaris]|uniref:2-keto-4-pentenoate hydratase n=1 Tax=Aliiruegeria lutimaris TaxID=571298 RepID=A0A1G8MRU3_9RHOB|nr:hydratase [Aliiruegeria lutimaris]SDI70691.1 2-keto-4-pentenoate hydratase [Aliiruegeria lutimaris]